MNIKKSTIEKTLGCLFVILYSTFGLGLSAVVSLSRLGVISAAIGVLWLFINSARIHKLQLFFVFSLIYLIFSWTWSGSDDLGSLGNVLTAMLGALLMAGALQRRWLSTSALLIVLCIPMIVNIYAYFNGINYTFENYSTDYDSAFLRFSGFVGHPNPYSLRLVLPLMLFVLFSIELKGNWLVFLFCLLSAIVAVLTSGSKRALIIFLLCLAFLFVFRTAKSTLAGGIFFIVSTFWMTDFLVFISNELEIESIKRLLEVSAVQDESTSERLQLISIAADLFLKNPLFGAGLDQFSNLSGLGYYSHNTFMEILVNGGFFGIFIYYGSILALIVLLLKRGRMRVVMIMLSFFIILDSTGVTYSDRAGMIFLMICFSCFFKKIYNENRIAN